MKLNFKYMLLIIVPMLSLGTIGIINLIKNQEYFYIFYTFLFWILLSGFGIAIGFHRIYSHRCFLPNKYFDRFLLICGTLACQSSSITWTSIHIGYHHRFTDTSKDPHTPIKGLFYSFLTWTLYINKDNINHKYAVNLIKDKWHLFFHKNYFLLVWLFVIILGIINWKILLYGYFIAASISIFQDNLVNVLGHIPAVGYRNFNTKDNSSNFPLLGYFGWGQGWHNNHHSNPKSFDFGRSVSGKWWEFDPCVVFLPLVKFFSKNENNKTL